MPDNCKEGCIMESRLSALEDANRRHSETHREIFDRLRDTETNTAVQAERMESIEKTLEEIKLDQKAILAKVDALEAKPAKRWDGLVDKLIYAAALAAVAWVAAGAPGLGG